MSINLFDLTGKQYHVSYNYLNSKVIFQSEDGKIQQKKIITDTKDAEIIFEEGYSLTFFDSPLGKLMRFKTEGEKFEFGNTVYIIKKIN